MPATATAAVSADGPGTAKTGTPAEMDSRTWQTEGGGGKAEGERDG